MGDWERRRGLLLDSLRRVMGVLAVAVFVVWIGFGLLAFRAAIHPPPYPIGGLPPAQFGLHHEEIRFSSRDGTPLIGWFLAPAGAADSIPLGASPCPGPADTRARLPIVVVHGIGAAMDDVVPLGAFLACAGHPVLLFDLRAHGRSGGEVSSLGLREAEDVRAAVDLLCACNQTETAGILAISLGAASAARAARDDTRVVRIALDSPFEDLSSIARYRAHAQYGLLGDAVFPFFAPFYRLRFGVWPGTVSPARALAARPLPVLVISGTADDLIPPAHHRALFEAASGPKKLLSFEGAWHCAARGMYTARYDSEVLSFFDESLP